MAGRGRPRALTKEKMDELVKAIQGGATKELATAFVGIAPSTLYETIRKGARALDDQERGEFMEADALELAEFTESLKKAEASAEISYLAIIQSAAMGSKPQYDAAGNLTYKGRGGTWQAAAWILERRFHERWARNSNVRLDAPKDGIPITIGENLDGLLSGMGKDKSKLVREFVKELRSKHDAASPD